MSTCLDGEDGNLDAVNNKHVRAQFERALQKAAVPLLGLAAPILKTRARAVSDPLSQAASSHHLFPDQQHRINYHPYSSKTAAFMPKNSRATSGDSDWEDLNSDDDNDDNNETGAEGPIVGAAPQRRYELKSAARTGNSGNHYQEAAAAAAAAASRRNYNNNPYAISKTTRFRNDDSMDLDLQEEEDEQKPFSMHSKRRDTSASRGTDQTDEFADFGLTELGKMERKIAAPKCGLSSPSVLPADWQ